MSRHHSWARSNSPKMLIPMKLWRTCCRHTTQDPHFPQLHGSTRCFIKLWLGLPPPSREWQSGHRHWSGSSSTSICVSKFPRRHFMVFSGEGVALSQVWTLMATCKQPSLGAWRAVQPWFDLVGYGASMRPSPVSPLVPLHHLNSQI